MSSTEEKRYGNRAGIGQHRSDGTGAPNSGQRTRRDPDADVSRPEEHIVPGSRPVNSGVPIHGEAE
jgi:hypothetical protein